MDRPKSAVVSEIEHSITHALVDIHTNPQALPTGYVNEFAPLLCGSPAMLEVKRTVEDVADTTATVLIRGESGVGKDVVARAIHAASRRHVGLFVKVNCAAMPAELLESELFGHERGAFTGAYRRKLGQFEYANNGTIYLDEIGDLPFALQAKLLHVLQDLTFTRIGGRERIKVNARVVAATNRDLDEALAHGDFREDLFYRLAVVDVRVPPLRERREEIAALASRFLERFNAQYRRDRVISPAVIDKLVQYPWPGNVRELENVVRRMTVLGAADEALETMLAPRPRPIARRAESRADPPTESLREIANGGARDAERKALAKVLEHVGGDRVEAARVLKISYKTLLNKLSQCGLAGHRRPR